MIEASPILPLLWQGSAPPPGPHVRLAGYDTLILCAEEYQPGSEEFPGVEVVYAPNDDDYDTSPTREQFALALRASRVAQQRVLEKKRVLVTCRMGRNRSGLVSALTLYLLGLPAKLAIEQVQKKRLRDSLQNPQFVRALLNLREPGYSPLVGSLR